MHNKYEYDATSQSGLVYKIHSGNRRKGDCAGSRNTDGYWRVQLNGLA